MAILEVVLIMVASAIWVWQWKDQRVCLHSDNETVVRVVNKGYSLDPSHAVPLFVFSLLQVSL